MARLHTASSSDMTPGTSNYDDDIFELSLQSQLQDRTQHAVHPTVRAVQVPQAAPQMLQPASHLRHQTSVSDQFQEACMKLVMVSSVTAFGV